MESIVPMKNQALVHSLLQINADLQQSSPESALAEVSAQNARNAQTAQQIDFDRMHVMNGILNELGALAVRASDQTMSVTGRKILQFEADALLDELSSHTLALTGQPQHTYVNGSVSYQSAAGTPVDAALAGFDLSTMPLASNSLALVEQARTALNLEQARAGTNVSAFQRMEFAAYGHAANADIDVLDDLVHNIAIVNSQQVQAKIAIEAYVRMQESERNAFNFFTNR